MLLVHCCFVPFFGGEKKYLPPQNGPCFKNLCAFPVIASSLDCLRETKLRVPLLLLITVCALHRKSFPYFDDERMRGDEDVEY